MTKKRSPRPPTREAPLTDKMQQAGFSKDAASVTSDMFASMGITAIRVGRTKLTTTRKPK